MDNNYIAWMLNYTFSDFVNDKIFCKLDDAIGTIHNLQRKITYIHTILNECSGSQINAISSHIDQIAIYLQTLERKFQDKKTEVQNMADIYQAKFDAEMAYEAENFPDKFGFYLYFQNGVQITQDTEVGGPDDNNTYSIYYFSLSTCGRTTKGEIQRLIDLTRYNFVGNSIETPMKIRYKIAYPPSRKIHFSFYYEYNNGQWTEPDYVDLTRTLDRLLETSY